MNLSLDEIKVRVSQLASSYGDRIWTGKPNLRYETIRFKEGFPPALRKAYLLARVESGEHVLAIAKDILEGKIVIFGKEVTIGDSFPWQKDVFHNRSSYPKFWKDIQFLDSRAVGDSKVVWELNRLQFLIPVAKAYFIAGDPAYYEWIRSVVLDWIRSNPYPKGINWASSLELAFRVLSIDWVERFCQPVISKDRDFTMALATMLFTHGRHIARYLSKYFSPNTHYTGEGLGLYTLGSRYPFLPGASIWRRKGREVLLSCLDRHVLADGGYFERSLWYHSYTLEIYLLFSLIADESGDVLPPIVKQKISDLSGFILQATRDDGTFPLIGDDDGGSLLPIDDGCPGDVRGLLAVVSAYLGRADLKYLAEGQKESLWWALGEEGAGRYEALPIQQPKATGAVYHDTGYAFLRDSWVKPSTVISFDAGPLGYGNCGHAHADALSITLSVGKEQVVIDPGTYSYTIDGTKRNLLRSLEAHSTLIVGKSRPYVPAKSPFHWERHSDKARFGKSFVGWDLDMVEGVSKAYQDCGLDLVHSRKLVFLKPRKLLIVWDTLKGSGINDTRVQYILAGKDWRAEGSTARCKLANSTCLSITGLATDLLAPTLEKFDFSPQYLSIEEGKRLSFSHRSSLPLTLITVFAWGEKERNMVFKRVSPQLFVICEKNEEIWCSSLSEGESISDEPLGTDALASCVIAEGGEVTKAWALSVSRLEFFSQPLLAAKRTCDHWEVP